MESQAFDGLSLEFAKGLSRRTILKTLAGACFYSVFGSFPRLGTAHAAQTCSADDITACIDKTDLDFERELEDCNEVPKPVACRSAARKRHESAVRACNPCSSGTRCESAVCCPESQATCAPPCSFKATNDGSILQYTVASSVAAQSLTLIASRVDVDPVSESAGGRITFNGLSEARGKKTVLLGTQLLFDVQYQFSGASFRADATYGPAFQGVESASCAADRDIVSCNVDGRAVIPFPRTSDPSLIRFTFADGKPPPNVVVDADLLNALKQILNEAPSAARACLGTAPSILQPFDNTHGSPGCVTCENACSDTAQELLDVAAAVSVACLFEAPACFAAAAAAIQVQYDGCRRGCEGPGAPCCPIQCDVGCCENGHTCCGSEGACCKEGEVCAGSVQGVGICCQQNSGPLCGKSCCESGQICADQNQGICCPTGSGLCGTSCCPNDSLCIANSICCGPKDKFKDCGDGQCCPKDAPCLGNSCCMPPSHVCQGGSECCAPFDVCCPDTCCGGDNLCIDGHTCCPRDQVCGRICCPPGQRCVNGVCAACAPGTVPCSSPSANGVVVSICCPPGAGCCLGVCCTNQTGHECTGPGGSCGTLH
jgi:hypothetical protein